MPMAPLAFAAPHVFAAVVGAVVDNNTREPRLDDAQVAKVCAVAKELRA